MSDFTLRLVREFLEAGEVPIPEQGINWNTRPVTIPHIQEELEELKVAVLTQNPEKTLDALVDLQYVLNAAIWELGFASVFLSAFEYIHEVNMSKRFPDGTFHKDQMGKIMKPPEFKPPSLDWAIFELGV